MNCENLERIKAMRKQKDLTEKQRIRLKEACDTIDDFVQDYIYFMNPLTVLWWTKAWREIDNAVPNVSEYGRNLNSECVPEEPDLRDPLAVNISK